MKIKKLFQAIPAEIRGSKDTEILGIATHSKKTVPGDLFIARKGTHFDGGLFIKEAVSFGASAVLTDFFDPSLQEITQVIVSHPEQVEGEIAVRFFDYPAKKLFCVGITGTSGKTTVSFLLYHLLEKLEKKSGLIGTLEYITGKRRLVATHTTPDVVMTQHLLCDMVHAGAEMCVMEVSSHALDQGRVYGIPFQQAIFTNLGSEHLDYHKTEVAYRQAKQKLFLGLQPEAWAIINDDDPVAEKMREGCKARLFSYGFSPRADLHAHAVNMNQDGTSIVLSFQGKRAELWTPFMGTFNVYNVLAVLSSLLLQGYPLEILIPLFKDLPHVPGRLEKVSIPEGPSVFIDFAHKENALENVVRTLRSFAPKKLIVVFGCGGERDSFKRPKMAAILEKYGVYPIVTNDNPRGENPWNIAQNIVQGFSSTFPYEIILDRREAIKRALFLAEEMDIILIAGKGHETYQIFEDKTIYFNDREVVQQLCMERKTCSI